MRQSVPMSNHIAKQMQEFIAIVIMVAFMVPERVSKLAGCQFLELFSGQARTSRLASWTGYKSKAVDYVYSPALDFLKSSGFVLLDLYIHQEFMFYNLGLTNHIYIYLVYNIVNHFMVL